jgi:hypothetical protein
MLNSSKLRSRVVARPKHLGSSIVVVSVVVSVVLIFCNLPCQNKLGLGWLLDPIRLDVEWLSGHTKQKHLKYFLYI